MNAKILTLGIAAVIVVTNLATYAATTAADVVKPGTPSYACEYDDMVQYSDGTCRNLDDILDGILDAPIDEPRAATVEPGAQSTTTTTAPYCAEDMSCWDCEIMGNFRCGTATGITTDGKHIDR